MPTMRAAVVEAANGPFRVSDLEHPVPKSGEVLVRIKASGVNPSTLKSAPERQHMPGINCPPSSGSTSRGSWRMSAGASHGFLPVTRSTA